MARIPLSEVRLVWNFFGRFLERRGWAICLMGDGILSFGEGLNGLLRI